MPLTLSISSSAKYFSLSFGRRTLPGHRVALAQREPADLRQRDVDVLGPRQVAGGPEEPVALGQDVQDAGQRPARSGAPRRAPAPRGAGAPRGPGGAPRGTDARGGPRAARLGRRRRRSVRPDRRRAVGRPGRVAARSVALRTSPCGRPASGRRLGGRPGTGRCAAGCPASGRSAGGRSADDLRAGVRLGPSRTAAGRSRRRARLRRTRRRRRVPLAVRAAVGARCALVATGLGRRGVRRRTRSPARPGRSTVRRRRPRARRSRRSARPSAASANPRCRGAGRSAAARG